MKNKTDKSLLEVWEMKERALNDFKKSGYTNYIAYIRDSVKDIKKEFYIKNFVKKPETA